MSAATTAASTADKRKRVFSNRTLTLGDLRVIHDQLAALGHDVRIMANETHLFDLDLLPALATEEVVLRTIEMTVIGADDEALQFIYEPGFIEIECGQDRAFRRPFATVCALLDAKPANGERSCLLDLATTQLPPLPQVSLPEERTTRIFRRNEPTPEPAGCTPRSASATDTPLTAALREPTPMVEATAITPLRIEQAAEPSRGLIALLRRLWGRRA